ncbi:hypothetical protein QEJ31_10980 [Pigmentibacter sp. JX0631]|uniref:hypothetical protein n=1 Tax=Pigmentibacter sp. JX0631 TaxID=2976982 RepID=UPI002468ABF7|nr:hypothetical protein [Pigmentibacter sp. JX0631]WGL59042.1 hypothetical protein QEJ31_10980 [Pigmentibacter sp. JX0631]
MKKINDLNNLDIKKISFADSTVDKYINDVENKRLYFKVRNAYYKNFRDNDIVDLIDLYNVEFWLSDWDKVESKHDVDVYVRNEKGLYKWNRINTIELGNEFFTEILDYNLNDEYLEFKGPTGDGFAELRLYNVKNIKIYVCEDEQEDKEYFERIKALYFND